MKIITLLLFPVLFTSVWHNREETATYYFCASKARTVQPDGKVHVYYSEINKMENDEALIQKKLKDWERKPKAACENKCTSDINTYPDAGWATKELNNFLKRYSDTSKYILTRVELK
jgi:NAD+--asparagine ADP-ribosyltransferase